MGQPPISIRGFLQETLDRVAGTQVDNLSCHMFTLGSAGPLYPSTIEAARPVYPEMTETIHVWKGIRNLQAMVESGEDYWVPVVDATHGRGMRFWAAMRFNDGHPGTHGLRGRFVVDHPEYRIGQRCAWRCRIGRAISPSRSSSTPLASRCAITSCPWASRDDNPRSVHNSFFPKHHRS